MNRMSVLEIQKTLSSRGFGPGEIDNIWGRRTIAAVRAFQQSVGLVSDGIVGPETYAALFPLVIPSKIRSPLLPWFEEAERLSGTREILGPRSNPAILDWAKNLEIYYPGDDVPWCGLFVAHCVATTMPEEILPNNPLGAREWERFADPTPPRMGAIMTFWRESKSGGKGHVGFYTGENTNAYRVLGGNQGDKVSIAWISKERFLRARWPRSAKTLIDGIMTVEIDKDADLSDNEV